MCQSTGDLVDLKEFISSLNKKCSVYCEYGTVPDPETQSLQNLMRATDR